MAGSDSPKSLIHVKAEFLQSASRTEECPAMHVPEYAFIGRSNVGKSSLINMLANHQGLAKTSGKPGKTQLINLFKMDEGAWSLVDLPGYGYARVSKVQRETFSKMISHYLRNRANLVNVFVLIDGRHEPQEIDLDFLRSLGQWGIPFSLVFTKLDKLSSSAFGKNQAAMKRKLLKEWENLPPMFLSSATSGLGRTEIIRYIQELNEEVGPIMAEQLGK
jgi:GTP-binding protein